MVYIRAGHAGIALRLSRLQVPLDAEKTLELGHHVLKAHLYKNMTLHKYSSRELQAHWISSVSADVSEALCGLRNIYSPNVKVHIYKHTYKPVSYTHLDVYKRQHTHTVMGHFGLPGIK